MIVNWKDRQQSVLFTLTIIVLVFVSYPKFGESSNQTINNIIYSRQATFVNNNPARLGFATTPELEAMSLDLHNMGIFYQNMGFVYPKEEFTLFLGGANNDYPNAGLEYSEKEIAFGFAKLYGASSIGVVANTMYVTGDFDVLSVKAKGISFNVGFENRFNNISYGVSIENLGILNWSFLERGEEGIKSKEKLESNLAAYIDIDYGRAEINLSGNTSLRSDRARLRASYKLNEQLKLVGNLSSNSKISCGFSLNLGRMIVDYSIIIHSMGTTENTHTFSTRFII